jgi:tetratricopeptide (TPR) repeat protein
MARRILISAMLTLAACATASSPEGGVGTGSALKPARVDAAETIKALSAICGAEARFATLPKTAADLKRVSGLGTGGFKVDTDNAEAQAWFDYGMKLYHAYYHTDAMTAMHRSVAADPGCSLCAWGEAWALGPTLNYPIDDNGRKTALAAAERARAAVKPGDDLARRLADAIVARYGEGGEAKTEPAFDAAMLAISRDYPDNLELMDVAAAAQMTSVRRGDESGVPTAVVMLQNVLKQRPDDTAAIHYYIHATEFAGRAEDAVAYADRLGRLAPAASHLVHMPAHTFFHAGRYQDAANVNADALIVDANWAAGGGNPAPPSAPTADVPMYYSHNLAFGLVGAMMSGDAKLALKYANDAARVWPETTPEAVRAYPIAISYLALARHDADAALKLRSDTKGDARLAIYRNYARGEAAASKGDLGEARASAKRIGEVKAGGLAAHQFVAQSVLNGRIAMLQNQPRKAATIFAAAAARQEKDLSKSWDPPPWWYPVRRSEAAALLKAGDFAKAEAAAQKSLAYWKRDPLALWVLGKAQVAQGRKEAGEATLAQAKAIWHSDFDSLTADGI